LGPIQNYVLSDLVNWLKDPDRDTNYLKNQLETADAMIADLQSQLENEQAVVSRLGSQLQGLQSQLNHEKTELSMLGDKISSLEGENAELQKALRFSKNLNYLAIGIAVISVIIAMISYQRRSA
jgi:chromosome segregation ATPase